MRILACGCVLGCERCIACRPGLHLDQERALEIYMGGPPMRDDTPTKAELRDEIERLRAALQLIDDYYQTGGDLMSHVAHIAQDALAGTR